MSKTTTTRRPTTIQSSSTNTITSSKIPERELADIPIKYLTYQYRIVFFVEEKLNYDIEINCRTLHTNQNIILQKGSLKNSCTSLRPRNDYIIQISAENKKGKSFTLRTLNEIHTKPHIDAITEITVTTEKITKITDLPILSIISLSMFGLIMLIAIVFIVSKKCTKRRKTIHRVVREWEPLETLYGRIT